MVEKSEKFECPFPKHANADETRNAILEAALDEFAAKSFEGARTREIAQKAKVNHAAINYHFGGKTEIYQRIITDTVDYFEKAFSPINDEVEEFLKTDGKNPKKAVEFIKKVLIFHHSFFYHPASQKIFLLMKREETFPTAAYETVFRKGFKPMHRNFIRLVDVATRFKKTQKEISMIAVALMGLNGALMSCRTPFLKMNKQTEITKEDTEMFTKVVSDAADKLL